MSSQVSGSQMVAAAVTAAGVFGGACYLYQRYKVQKTKLPEEWKFVGTLKKIYVYPIKSCGPVVLEKAECSTLGLRDGWLRDRVLMVVNDKNNFQTARVHPEMLLVEPSMRNSILTLKHANMEPCYVNLAEVAATQPVKTANVWSIPVPVYDCGNEASEWISKVLDRPAKDFRLVYYASQNPRQLRSNSNKIFKFRKDDAGALPDETSFNLINEASVFDLNHRVKDTEVTERNFRPNFVLSGAEPYDEDNWRFIKIGENIFEVIKPCTRCVLTTIDPETGVHNLNSEPLETLKGYRQIEDPEMRKVTGTSPRMGLQMALRSGPGGIVSTNDPIYIA